MRPASSPPRLMTLILLTGLSVLSLNMFLPSLNAIATEFDAPYATVSLAIAGYLGVTALVQLTAGPLSDRIGRRPVALGALIIFLGASVGCALSQDVVTFLAFRMIQAAMVAGHVIASAAVRDTRGTQQAAGTLAFINMAMALAPMLGPMLGGVLDTLLGWRANFWFYTGAGAIMLAVCWADLGETRAVRSGTDDYRDSPLVLLRYREYWAYALCTMFSTGAFYGFLAGAPLVAAQTFGISTALLGVIIGSITLGFIAGNFVSTRMAARVPLPTMMLAGRIVACFGLTIGVAILALGEQHLLTYFGATIFIGVGNGLTLPNANAGALSVRPDLAGSAAGFNGAMTVAGGAALTSLAGVLVSGPDAAMTLLLILLATSLAGLLASLWARALHKA